MGNINYKSIYELNQNEWQALTREPQKYEALLAGHYSDSNHFVYELLQNAEDEKATKVVFEYYHDKLIFYHDGAPFDEDDVKGVSSMLMGTKDMNSAQTIGRFGMGFKSVFKYTYQPEIYSDDEAFYIKNYLLPVEIENGWDYNKVKESLIYSLSSGKSVLPFVHSEHLTKIIIPFKKKEGNVDFAEIESCMVLNKIKSLNGEILLFLMHIKELYWVDIASGEYAIIRVNESKDDKNIKNCSIEGTGNGVKEENSIYLKFTKIFDHPDMKFANVSIAYKLNARANNVNEIPNTNVWVYFPTKDKTKFPFLIHGSFETAVSREKLMEPSDFNRDIYDQLGNLLCESLIELRNRNLITQMFIRKSLLVAMEDEQIPNLRNKITSTFLTNNLLPDKANNYRKMNELNIAVPFKIGDFMGNDLFKDSFRGVKSFIQFNNEKEINFTEYYTWLKDDLHINIFSLESWANRLSKYDKRQIGTKGKAYDIIKEFYAFLSDYLESNSSSSRPYGSYYGRSGPYETKIKECLGGAWKLLRKSALILSADGKLKPAYIGKKNNIYLNSSSQYKRLMLSTLVNMDITKKFENLLTDGFHIPEFNNFQYVKEKVIKKYINIDNVLNFDNFDNYEDEYVNDIKQIIHLIDESNENEITDIKEIIKNAYIIRVISKEGEVLFSKPEGCYADISVEGINLDVYFKDITDGYYHIDYEFYNNNKIPTDKLQEFGLYSTVIKEGTRNSSGGSGCESWNALGEYCPYLNIEYLPENIRYVEEHPNDNLSREKSAEILKLLLKIKGKLSGTMRRRKTNPYDVNDECFLLTDTIKLVRWLYNKNEELCYTKDISKYDLNTAIYGQVVNDKDAYNTLGFIETYLDKKVDAFELIYSMGEREQKILLNQLARKFSLSLTKERDVTEEDTASKNDTFILESWDSRDFPNRMIKNKESLIEYVRQEFFFADPIKYQNVWRQLRVSKNLNRVRSYVISMYTNESDVRICQMCKEPIEQIEVTAIANYGIEMNQLNLCLCRNCAGRYKKLRDNNKDIFKKEINKSILSLDVDGGCINGVFEVKLSSENSIQFTQTHLAEIQTIFSLLDEYGLPCQDPIFDENISGLSEEIAVTT